MVKVSKNTIAASVIGALTIVYLYEALKLPFGAARMPDMGFVPVLAGFLVLGLCLLLIGKDLLHPVKTRPGETPANQAKDEGGSRKPLLLSLALIVYPLILVPVGFIPSTIGLMFYCLWVMKYRGWLGSLIIALLATGAAHLLFTVWLHVPFPRGILD
jgi:hypothetical protein